MTPEEYVASKVMEIQTRLKEALCCAWYEHKKCFGEFQEHRDDDGTVRWRMVPEDAERDWDIASLGDHCKAMRDMYYDHTGYPPDEVELVRRTTEKGVSFRFVPIDSSEKKKSDEPK